ncbi:MAG: transpeptidase family protein [Bacteroidales bacterium]|nr:transpeptidase family protein [Bacteroidales bacterium]MBN2699715.1 transpeptidase family protein [Bacteroidales bacterium]
MSLKKDILIRVSLVYLGIVIFGLMILGKAFYLQIFEKDQWKRSENNTVRHKIIEPNRGNIYSADGLLLAVSVPYYEIRMDMQSESFTREIFDRHVDELSKSLSEFFKDRHWTSYKRELVRAREEGNRYFLVKRNITYTQLQEVKKFPIFNLGPYRGGFIYVQQNQRIHPYGMLASRTIGYTMKGPVESVVGIEGAYNRELRGVEGYRLMRRIRGDVWMPINDRNEVEPRDGHDVVTTIDVDLQDVAENALMNQLMRHEADHGSIVLMEVQTGKIRAIANLSRNENGTYGETYNFAIGESTEPGSTFKLASMIAILEDGYVRPEEIVDVGNGVVEYYGKRIEDSGEIGLGKISIQHAFEVSSNVGISKIINEHYKDNPSAFIDRLYQMGLNRKLGLEIRGEGRPEIKYTDSDLWSGISLPMMSLGYEVRMTPLQILTLYNAIANDGKMIKPVFAEEIRYRGKTVKKIETKVLNHSICSNETLSRIKIMLEGVVENGTARNLRNSHYQIAGKTGTAQIALDKQGYTEALYQASFVGYFPADKPKYSCIVVVNAPSKSIYYGNLVAGPIFREITDRIYVREYDLHRDAPEIASQKELAPYSKSGLSTDLINVFDHLGLESVHQNNQTNWVSTRSSEEGIILADRSIIPELVPNVRDMGLKDAIYLLENSGLKVIPNGRGTVRSQSLEPGTRIRKGDVIILEMSITEG